MSRVIRNDHLWTPEEVDYVLARSGRKEVEANKALYGSDGEHEGQDHRPTSEPDSTSKTLELDSDIYDYVVNLKGADLEKALKKYNVDPRGNEQEQKTKLAEYLQGKRDDSTNQ